MATGVRQLAIVMLGRLESGALDAEALEALTEHISDQALRDRAARLGAQTPAVDWASVVDQALAPLKGAPFQEIKAAIEKRRAGIVFTAHPTFALSRAMRDALGALADEAAAKHELGAHAPDPNVSLREEAGEAGAQAGYPEIARGTAAPLRALDAAIKRVSVGIGHFYGAFG